MKEELYNEIDRICKGISKYDIMMQIRTRRDDIHRATIGMHSEHESSNENSTFLIDFAWQKNYGYC